VSYILAADTGGTFTDLAAYDSETGSIQYTKSLTTYGDLVDGVMDCLRKADIDLSRAEVVKFGTTLVINTYVQRNGARAALVTTAGFRDVLEARRGNRPLPFDLRYKRDPILIERDLRFEVAERMTATGEELRPLDERQLSALAETLRKMKVEAVAVSFLNSYTNSEHEDRAAALLRRELPGVYVTAGTELTREWYEYERSSTAAANAYVGPKLKDYVERLDGRLRQDGFGKTFYMMASNGGVVSTERACRQPVALVESGPVGGVIGAGVYGEQLGISKIIAFDMGGTTAKCAVVEDGRFEVKSPYYVGGYERGFPVRGAVVDIVEVGAGGGSIAWLDSLERLLVGPRSAGSDPGPVCYGRGGTEPTITDANLVLGRIGAKSFLGGEMSLDAAAAADAISRTLALPLGFVGESGLDEMAQGIIAIGSTRMAGAIKQITVERGLDPRDFTMFAFGGGGPLHSAALARELSIPQVIIPPEPGNFSALGMILSDARIDETQTFLRPLAADSIAEIGQMFRAMEERARKTLATELKTAQVMFEHQAEMRFRGQKHSTRVNVPLAAGEQEIRQTFYATYRRRYGHVDTDGPVEFVSLVLTAVARGDKPSLQQLRPATRVRGAPVPTTRPVYFAERARRLETPVYQRAELPVGFSSAGPAIIEEYGSTTVIGPDDSFTIGELAEIRIQFN
jgi:N-methylhydantoinase A